MPINTVFFPDAGPLRGAWRMEEAAHRRPHRQRDLHHQSRCGLVQRAAALFLASLDNHVSSSVNTTRALTRKKPGNFPCLIAVEGNASSLSVMQCVNI